MQAKKKRGHPSPLHDCLHRSAPEAQPLDQGSVPVEILVHEISEESSPGSDHLQEAPPGMEIFGMNLKVFGKVSDTLSQHCDLDLRRSGVRPVGTVFPDYFLFLFLFQHVCHLSIKSRNPEKAFSPDPSLGRGNTTIFRVVKQTCPLVYLNVPPGVRPRRFRRRYFFLWRNFIILSSTFKYKCVLISTVSLVQCFPFKFEGEEHGAAINH